MKHSTVACAEFTSYGIFTLMFPHQCPSDTPIRILYILRSIGIDPGTVPLGHDGQPNVEGFLQHLEKRQKQEKLKANSSLTSSDLEKQS